MDATQPYKFIWFGDIHGPKHYEFMGIRVLSIVTFALSAAEELRCIGTLATNGGSPTTVATPSSEQHQPSQYQGLLLYWKLKSRFWFWSILQHFPAKLGPKTPSTRQAQQLE